MTRLTITRPDDWHLHLRDGDHMRAVLPDAARRFARAIVMPNLCGAGHDDRPGAEVSPAHRVRGARALELRAADDAVSHRQYAAREIQRAKASGVVHAVKYYPAGATTNSESGVSELVKMRRSAGRAGGKRAAVARARRSHLSQRRHLRSRAAVYRPRAAAGAAKISEVAPGVRAHHDQGSRRVSCSPHRRRVGGDDHRAPPTAQSQRAVCGRDPARITSACRS